MTGSSGRLGRAGSTLLGFKGSPPVCGPTAKFDAAEPFAGGCNVANAKAEEVVGWRADEDGSAPPEGTIAPCVPAPPGVPPPAAGGAVVALGMLWDFWDQWVGG